MTLSPERKETPDHREIIFDKYGVYIVTSQDAYLLADRRDEAIENPENVVLVS